MATFHIPLIISYIVSLHELAGAFGGDAGGWTEPPGPQACMLTLRSLGPGVFTSRTPQHTAKPMF